MLHADTTSPVHVFLTQLLFPLRPTTLDLSLNNELPSNLHLTFLYLHSGATYSLSHHMPNGHIEKMPRIPLYFSISSPT